MKYDAKYRYYAEDINKVGSKLESPQAAYHEAKIDLNKLGYEVTELDTNLQFDYISKSTGVRYEGSIGILYDESKLEDGWMFEIEDDGRRVIYKEDDVYGNIVVSKLPDGYYEFEDDEGGFPEVFPNLRRLTIKKRLHIPNSVIQELEGNNDMSVKRVEESLKAELEKVYEDAEEYKEYSIDEALEPQVNSVGDIVAENAEAAMKSMAVVIDYIEDAEIIAKLEEAADLLRQMVPHLQ